VTVSADQQLQLLQSCIDEFRVLLSDLLTAKKHELIRCWLKLAEFYVLLQNFQQATDCLQKAQQTIAKREKEQNATCKSVTIQLELLSARNFQSVKKFEQAKQIYTAILQSLDQNNVQAIKVRPRVRKKNIHSAIHY
jgi:tetratricopeptide (TPR) repeat protein